MAKLEDRKTFVVPVTSGQYAPERITFNTPDGVAPLNLLGVTALIEANAATGAVLELWLPRVGLGTTAPLDAEYFYAGQLVSSGSGTWPLSSYPGAQLRAKSTGVAGNMVVSATADYTDA